MLTNFPANCRLKAAIHSRAEFSSQQLWQFLSKRLREISSISFIVFSEFSMQHSWSWIYPARIRIKTTICTTARIRMPSINLSGLVEDIPAVIWPYRASQYHLHLSHEPDTANNPSIIYNCLMSRIPPTIPVSYAIVS